MTDPRTELRDRIAAKMADWLGEQCIGEPFPEDELANAVMELFVDVRPSPWLRAGYVIAELGEPSRSPSTESETP